jgi:hypothetical protein
MTWLTVTGLVLATLAIITAIIVKLQERTHRK